MISCLLSFFLDELLSYLLGEICEPFFQSNCLVIFLSLNHTFCFLKQANDCLLYFNFIFL